MKIKLFIISLFLAIMSNTHAMPSMKNFFLTLLPCKASSHRTATKPLKKSKTVICQLEVSDAYTVTELGNGKCNVEWFDDDDGEHTFNSVSANSEIPEDIQQLLTLS